MKWLVVVLSLLIASPAWALSARNFPGSSTTDYLTNTGTVTWDFANKAFLVVLKPANFTTDHVIAAHGSAGARGWDFTITSAGKLRMNSVAVGSELGTVVLSTGVWYAVMYYKASGAGGVTLKVMPMSTQTVSSETINTGSYAMVNTSNDTLTVGNWMTRSNNDAFAGVMQRAAYVNTSVSDADFKTWANGGATPTGTVSAWSIQGDSPEQDLTATNQDLTVNGTTVVAGYSARTPVAPLLLGFLHDPFSWFLSVIEPSHAMAATIH